MGKQVWLIAAAAVAGISPTGAFAARVATGRFAATATACPIGAHRTSCATEAWGVAPRSDAVTIGGAAVDAGPDATTDLERSGDVFAVARAGLRTFASTAGAGAAGGTDFLATGRIARLPEPASWALMILGFGVSGLGLRRALRRSEERFTARLRSIVEEAEE